MTLKIICILAVLCVVLELVLPGVNAAHVVREKRSDDAGPLQDVVDQLSQQVNSLSAQLTAQLTSVNAELSALRTKTANLDTTVAFYAWNNARPVSTVIGGTIILNHAVTNIGNAYDTTTGVFIVPVSGLYDFQASILPNAAGHQSNVGIYVDSDLVAVVVADTEHNQWDQPTMRAIVNVVADQHVRLVVLTGYTDFFSEVAGPFTAFSGYLIKAD